MLPCNFEIKLNTLILLSMYTNSILVLQELSQPLPLRQLHYLASSAPMHPPFIACQCSFAKGLLKMATLLLSWTSSSAPRSNVFFYKHHTDVSIAVLGSDFVDPSPHILSTFREKTTLQIGLENRSTELVVLYIGHYVVCLEEHACVWTGCSTCGFLHSWFFLLK